MANTVSSYTIGTPAGPGTLNITLEVNGGLVDGSGVAYTYAPHSFSVEAFVTNSPVSAENVGNYDATFHKIYYVHDHGDPGTLFTVPSLPPGATRHKNRNESIGKFAQHMYRTPGTYTWTVHAYDIYGNWGSASFEVVVKDPDNGTDGYEVLGNTIIVADDGNFTGAPPSLEVNRVTTWVAAISRINAIHLSGNKNKIRVLLKRGGGYTVFSNWRQDWSTPSHIWGDWGAPTDPRPVIMCDESYSNDQVLSAGQTAPPRQFKMFNLEFDWNWDSTVERFIPFNTPTLFISGQHWIDWQLDNCTMSGTGVMGNPGNSNYAGARAVVSEVAMTDFKDFMQIASANYDYYASGVSIVQNVNALNGAENRGVTSESLYARNAHHGFRGSYPRFSVCNSELFGKHGWTIQNIFLDQPMFRLNSAGISVTSNNRYIVARNFCETSITGESANGETQATLNGLLTQNYVIGRPTDEYLWRWQAPGWTARDNIFVMPAVPKLTTPLDGFIFFNKANTDATGNDGSNLFYSNTFVSLASNGDGGNGVGIGFDFIRNPAGHEKQFEWDNVFYAPNHPTPVTDAAPLDLTSIGKDARYPGVARGWERSPASTMPLTVANGESFVVPYWNDWYGNPLTEASFAGAWIRNAITVNNVIYDQPEGAASFVFGPTGITITNLSGVTWTTGQSYRVYTDRGTTPMAMDTFYATPPGSTAVYTALSGSSGYQAGSANVSFYDYFGNVRRGTLHPDSPAGTPSKGATEPT